MDVAVVVACSSALLAAAGWGFGTILFERFMSGRADAPSAAACNLFKNCVAGIVFLLVAWLTGASAVRGDAWGVLLISGVLGFALGDTFTFAALPRCGVQLTALLGNLVPPISGLLSWVFLGESLSLFTIGAMGVVIVGVTIVITGGEQGTGSSSPAERKKGVMLAIGAALAQGVAIVVGRHGLQGVDVFPGTLVRLLGGIGGALAIAVIVGLLAKKGPVRELRELAKPITSRRLAVGLLLPTFFASILILPLHSLALRGAPGAIAAALFATTPLFTLPLGLIYGVRPSLRTVLGTVIGFVGAVGAIIGTS